jgi:hypothetical protein
MGFAQHNHRLRHFFVQWSTKTHSSSIPNWIRGRAPQKCPGRLSTKLN